MLRILGSAKRFCDGISRRDWLRVGGLGLAGLSLSDLLRSQSAAKESSSATAARSFGKAKSIILIHLYGSPSQLEWVDCKPEAPLEIRGELGSITSTLPGCRVCELMPKLATVLDKTTVIRSMTHPYPIHGVAYALTGAPTIDVPMELNPQDRRHWPYFGSVVDYIDQARDPSAIRREIPTNLALPFRFSSQRVGEVPRAGPYAAFLGGQYDPVWTEFVGEATRGRTKTLNAQSYDRPDPYMGVDPEAHFAIPSATSFPKEISLDRLSQRRSLLSQFEAARRELGDSAAGRTHDRFQEMAWNLIGSENLRHALDVRREPESVRDAYGRTLFGQGCLAARRLVEAGGRVVSLFWDEYGLAGTGWDTHWDHYARMKEELCPGYDTGFAALIADLDARGLLDETLVVCTSEHGRTPKIKPERGGGRDHWSRVYSTIVAGGGTRRGLLLGSSDKQGGDVLDRPTSPKDLLATMYHLLGIDPRTIVHDALTRPLPLVDGELVEEIIA